MQSFNAKNWYWAVVGNASQVYSSARNIYVPVTDADFLAWVAAGFTAAAIHSEAEIWPYVSAPPVSFPDWLFNGTTFAQPTATTYSREQLKAYAASVRYNKETGGTAVNGFAVATDRGSQALINGAYSMAARDSAFSTKWKMSGGAFAALDAPTIIALATAVGQHVADCFAKEAEVGAQIDAGTLISLPEINAAFAAI